MNVLFDSGSQKSYIVESLRKALSLKSEKTETLNLNTFGNDKYEKKSCDRVRVNLEVLGDVVSISALCNPVICSPVMQRIKVKEHPHLSCLELANSFNCST